MRGKIRRKKKIVASNSPTSPRYLTEFSFFIVLTIPLISLLHSTVSLHYSFIREVIPTTDDGIFALDWYPPLRPEQNNHEQIQTVAVLLPGLTGGSHELYIQSCIHYLTSTHTSSTSPSIQTVVLNARGCSGTIITTPRLFSAGDTEDLEIGLAHIRKRMGDRIKIVGVGYSLGANLLVGVRNYRCTSKDLREITKKANPISFYADLLTNE